MVSTSIVRTHFSHSPQLPEGARFSQQTRRLRCTTRSSAIRWSLTALRSSAPMWVTRRRDDDQPESVR